MDYHVTEKGEKYLGWIAVGGLIFLLSCTVIGLWYAETYLCCESSKC